VVFAAVAQDGRALEYASPELKADKEVVLAAVAQDGFALEYASEELKADKEVVLAAVAQEWGALEYASAELKADKEVVLAAVAQDGFALEYDSVELKADKEVVLAAVAQDGRALEFASIARVDFGTYVRNLLVAHDSFIAFILAAHPFSGPATRPALRKLEDLGEDAGLHMRRLVADYAGVPCGRAWVLARAAAENITPPISRDGPGE